MEKQRNNEKACPLLVGWNRDAPDDIRNRRRDDSRSAIVERKANHFYFSRSNDQTTRNDGPAHHSSRARDGCFSCGGDVYRGSWLFKGDAILCCDMSLAAITDRDDEKKTAVIKLPKPRVVSPRVDHERTRTWSVERSTWLPWKWGNQDKFRDSAMHHAQRLVEKASRSQENLSMARTQAELVIRKTYEMVDWHVTVNWE